MTDTNFARTRLGSIADLGFSIVSHTAGDGLSLIISTHTPEWSVLDLRNWQEKDDALFDWMKQNLGVVDGSEIGSGAAIEACLKQGKTTIISEFYSGSRLGMVLTHSANQLDDITIKEAKAAAFILKLSASPGTAPGITTKEEIYLKQVSTGATDDEIATDLQLSLRAVKERKRKAIDDLQAENIGHAVGIAKRSGLI